MAIYFALSLHLLGNVTNKPPCGPCFHAVLNKKVRILIFMDLLKVEAIFEGHVAGFPDIFPKGLTAHS